ncbi:hypothetical protein L210DRAFT_3531499 [Boletus edulis BED1]|uniref:Secreted protein n=1 Tax=Boletus edulis BED1 TaxID=1328754 RepID=A0AAD4C0C6_BOLED|nr:hypothetical protein L210DRAFT_3531499 [Boletus edulis BED1]
MWAVVAAVFNLGSMLVDWAEPSFVVGSSNSNQYHQLLLLELTTAQQGSGCYDLHLSSGSSAFPSFRLFKRGS